MPSRGARTDDYFYHQSISENGKYLEKWKKNGGFTGKLRPAEEPAAPCKSDWEKLTNLLFIRIVNYG